MTRRHPGPWIAITLLATAAASGCSTSGAVPRPFPTPRARSGSGAAPLGHATVAATALLRTALALQGAPYRNGGADPGGFDCSGFVQYVFSQHGVALPRNVTAQAGAGGTAGALRAGDLVFFAIDRSAISHVGIALGADRFVHAPSSRGVVRVELLSSPYWSTRYRAARRVLGG